MNKRMLKFVASYAQHGNATQAAIESGYSPTFADKVATRLLKRDDVMQAIRERMNAGQPKGIVLSVEPIVSHTWLVDQLKTIVQQGDAPPAARVSAIAQLGKMMGFDKPRTYLSFSGIGEGSDDRLKAVSDACFAGKLPLETTAQVIGIMRDLSELTGDDAGFEAVDFNAIHEEEYRKLKAKIALWETEKQSRIEKGDDRVTADDKRLFFIELERKERTNHE